MKPPNDFLLSQHFTYHELTKTSNKNLLALNRVKGLEFEAKLKELAFMLEAVREYVGGPLSIHSGYRCPELNGATPGSSSKSQHMLGEACDFSLIGPDTSAMIDSLFQKTLTCLIDKGIPFGQLIRELANRDYGKAEWIHLSLGMPHREIHRCGQVMTMEDGVYKLIKTVPFGR
mgnify:CR=1 FL=1